MGGRKTLTNAVTNYSGLEYTKDEVEKALKELGLPETVRGEALDLRQFAALSNILT